MNDYKEEIGVLITLIIAFIYCSMSELRLFSEILFLICHRSVKRIYVHSVNSIDELELII